jgi:hypothetical protein
MSKVSSADYPSYSSSSISVGDSTASTGVSNGVLTSNYDMSDAESTIYNYALNTLASILPSINTFDTNTQSEIQSEVNAYKDEGVQEINDLYNSSLSDLQNDSASRFGNLDNSIFTDSLSDLESERSDAVSSFAQDVLSKQSSLESDELTQRYALIELLSGLSDDIYSNALDSISTSLGSSSSYSDYNSSLYDAISAMESTGSSSSTSSLLSSLLGSSSSSLSSLLSLL